MGKILFEDMLKAEHPIHLLGLPAPEKISLSCTQLHTVYRDYCQSLEFCGNQMAITCNSDLFCFSDNITESDLAKFRLLSALCRPDEDGIGEIKERLRDVEKFDNRSGIHKGHIRKIHAARALREFANFRQSADYQTLTEGTTPSIPLMGFSLELMSAPGMTWSSHQSVVRFNQDWAIALYFGDSEDREVDAFPTVLGFVRMDPLHRSFGHLVLKNQYAWVSEGSFLFSSGCTPLQAQMLSLCMRMDEDAMTPKYGEMVLELTDEEMETISKEYGELDSSKFLKELDELYYEFDASPSEIIHYARPIEPGFLDRAKVVIKRKYDEQNNGGS
jgi:hypothetical protein